MQGNTIIANVVRLYRYLVPSYESEFASNLRRWLVQTFTAENLVFGDVLPPEQRPNYGLLSLYGSSVFPQELQNFLNMDILQLRHICSGAERHEDLSTLRGRLYNILYRWLLVHEDKPIITRFWLFSACVCRVLLAKLLKMPVDIFSLHLIQPRAQNAKRLQAFQEFFGSDAHQLSLRIAVLCLRITTLATNLTAKKRSGTEDASNELPVSVLLGQSYVQQRTNLSLTI